MQIDPVGLAFQLTISAVTLTCEYLKGNKWPHVWKLALASQALWAAWIVYDGAWGLAPLTIALTVIFLRNWWKWRKEARGPRTVFGTRICAGCETQRNCAQHGCKNKVDAVPRSPCALCSMRGPQGQCCGVYARR